MIEKQIERYFELIRELRTVEKNILQTVIKTNENKVFHNFKIVSDDKVEFKDARTGAVHGVTPPAVTMHLERDWIEL